jgi:hypothetical protein
MAANYVLLERVTVGEAGASSITFNSIPQTGYTDLKIVASARTTYAGFLEMGLFFNGNASSGYSYRRLVGDGASATSGNATTGGSIITATLGTTATANVFSSHEIYIPNYTSTNSKSVSIDSTTENNATTSYLNLVAGLSTLATAITSVGLGIGAGNFVQYSTFSLYGLAALGTTPTKAPKASGGSIIQTDGTYWYHAFLASGTFTPATALSCDVLVVAGGGGGGAAQAGGGGAGGVLAFASQLTSATAQTITVGGGGAGAGQGTYNNGVSGTNSQFAALTASVGGGYGTGAGTSGAAGTGGSGGGAAGNTFPTRAGGSGTSGQGNAGGNGVQDGSSNSTVRGGGGGGAGSAGANATYTQSGAGGSGTNSVTNWGALSTVLTTTGLGVSGYIAGGGGGGGNNSGAVGAGGSGGGTAGTSATANCIAATPNTGSGGGGGGNIPGSGGATGAGGNGGSGIVIIRYAV